MEISTTDEENVKKEREETKSDGGWEKADFIKQVDVGHFTALIQKGYKNTTHTHSHIHTHTHSVLTQAEIVNDREWREGQWMIKYLKVL